MNKIIKSPSTSSPFFENSTTLSINTQNALSLQRILYQRPAPSTTPRTDQSYPILNSIDNNPFTRSILIDNAVQQRGFLPYDYRTVNTFESIRRQRAHEKISTKLPAISCPVFHNSSTRSDVFGNSTSTMSRLAFQRLVLRDKSNRQQHNSTPSIEKQEKAFHTLSDADFATDIPNALEMVLRNTKRNSTMERHLLETLKRERLQQARYRLLPINKAPFG